MPIFSFFRAEPKGVHQAALLLAVTSALNGLLGLVRDRLLAGTYGASRELDIYYAAFRVPDFIFSFSLFLVASTAFIPLFLEYRERSEQDAQMFFRSLFTAFCVAIVCMSVVAYIAMPWLLRFLAPGFDGYARAETATLARILLLSPLFLGLSNLFSGVLQASKKFLAYALSPVAYNLSIIFGVAVLSRYFGLPGLAYGVVLGAFLHAAIQIPALRRVGIMPRFSFDWNIHPFRIVQFSFPRAVALSWNQITLFILTAIASTLGAGAISIFNLSYNLHTLPLIVIGLSYSVAAFPTIAEMALKNKKALFFEHVLSAVRHILFWTVPIAGLTIVLRAHIVRLVLGTGSFAWLDTRLTAAALVLFAFAIVFQSLVTLFVRAYYALGRVREPIAFNIVSSLVTIFYAFAAVGLLGYEPFFEKYFGRLFRVEDLVRGTSVDIVAFLALPAAYALGSLVNAVLLGVGIFSINGKEELRVLGVSLLKITGISVLMSSLAFLVLKVLAFISLDTFLGVLAQGGGAAGAAIFFGIVLFRWFDVREYFEVRDAIKSRFSREGVLQPETEHL